METKFTQQEILLMTNTSFSRQQWSEKQESENGRNLSPVEQLEDACWNGLLYEMFPGIIEKTPKGKALFLWQVRHNATSLEMELCEYPNSIDPLSSIDPYTIMENCSLS